MPNTKLRVSVAGVLSASMICVAASGAGSITGRGRFEQIAGKPSMGYQELYEWDLFLSPSDDSMTGLFRRLGAPPGQMPTGDGYYRIDNVPAGTYSVYVNQPDFFASPKVIPNVEIANGQVRTLNVELDIDYSTYFHDTANQQWSGWEWAWHQTFLATGTNVRGVSWKMAGGNAYNGKYAKVSILEDNGNPNPRHWTELASKNDNNISADSDEWVRWPSGVVPLTPGRKHAVKIWIEGGFAVYKRDKDSSSYPHGRAYSHDGNPQNYDLCVTVFVDKNNQTVTHTRLSSGLGELSGSGGTRWCQSFTATGEALAAADIFAASGEADMTLTWRIRRDGPGGPQVGPTKIATGAYFASSTDLIGVSYNPDQIPLVPGRKYCIEITDSQSFTPYFQESWQRYADGNAYKGSTPLNEDLAMTIVEYIKGPEPEIADVDRDLDVDMFDFAGISAFFGWRGQSGAIRQDLIRDGSVDFLELDFISRTWLDYIPQPPRVYITSPSAGAEVSTRDEVLVLADATDPDGFVTGVEFLAGDDVLGTDNDGADGWSVAKFFSAGQYTLTAVATDNDGMTAHSEPVAITVKMPPR